MVNIEESDGMLNEETTTIEVTRVNTKLRNSVTIFADVRNIAILINRFY